MSDGTDPGKVAARLMDLWPTDPFLKEIKVNVPWPQCPFREQTWCRAADVKGTRKARASLSCPVKDKNENYRGAPMQCPLRHGSIEVRMKP